MNAKPEVVTRFAPTPSGFLHKGNGLSLLITWLVARKLGGKIWLRIDDLDAPRIQIPFIDEIFRTLEWLGLDYDTGPSGTDDFLQHHSQQLRIPRYLAALQTLQAQGHLFACTCSRATIRAQAQDGGYPGTCRVQTQPLSRPHALRFATDVQELILHDLAMGETLQPLPPTLRHFVIRRKEGLPAYQLASLCDDLDHRVNYIIRGYDLLGSTVAQCLLAKHLPGGTTFQQTVFYHHPLVKDLSGEKLSKSAGATSLLAMRQAGMQPQAFYQWAGKCLGLRGDTPSDFLEQFAVQNLPEGKNPLSL
jgi:glutamyl-tRNA synthetase